MSGWADPSGFAEPGKEIQPRGQKRAPQKKTAEKKPRKPRKPVAQMDVDELRESVRKDPRRRPLAAVALKTAGYSFVEIAQLLEYQSVKIAKQEIYAALADSVDDEDVRNTRRVLIMQAEGQLKRSAMHAAADRLVDEDGEEYQNYDQLAWHHAAREDMRLLGQLTGSFAPMEIHHKISDAEIAQLVNETIEVVAGDVVDAEVLDG